jgi:hypothetical protein
MSAGRETSSFARKLGTFGGRMAPPGKIEECVLRQGNDVGCSRNAIHRHHCQKHQQRCGKRVEEESEARIDPPRMSPDADDEEHRDKAALEEKIEQHEIESTAETSLSLAAQRLSALGARLVIHHAI